MAVRNTQLVARHGNYADGRGTSCFLGKRANVICTVSTVKDSLPNITNFVRRNLAAGADHMFIFLEGGDREVLQFLDDHHDVTVIDTENGYWHKGRPTNLNARQVMNANLINCLLAGVESAEWLFHIDGDECLHIDKDRLQELDPDIEYVRLATKESVSTSVSQLADSVYFKRLLSDDELALLSILGVIEAPRNRNYFHGHVSGKVGIRPSMDYVMRIHEAKRLQGPTPENFRADWLSMLHYESFTPEEFLRKWTVHIEAGKQTRFRNDKEAVRGAITAIVNNPHLNAEQKKQYLLEIYKRRLEDDVSTLLALGLIEAIPENRHKQHPQTFPKKDVSTIAKVLPELIAVEKGYFKPQLTNLDPRDLMARIQSKVGDTDSLFKAGMKRLSKLR